MTTAVLMSAEGPQQFFVNVKREEEDDFSTSRAETENHTETEEADDNDNDEIQVLYHVTQEDRDTIAFEGPGFVVTRAQLIQFGGCITDVPEDAFHDRESYLDCHPQYQHHQDDEPEQQSALKGRHAEANAFAAVQSPKKRRVVPASDQ